MSDPCRCYLCGTETDEENWCFGCKQYICKDHLNEPWGGHEPEEHNDDYEGDDC